MLETGAGGPSLIEDAEDGAVAMRRGRWRAGRLDANGRRRPEWTAAFDALVKARLDPAPDTVEAARASLHRLAASIGLLAGS